MIFKNIENIEINNNESWKGKIFLTFDIDWCSDKVLLYTLDILEKYDVKATFFVTHETKLLDKMRKNKNIELGIHPNFNPLLNGDFRYGKNIDEVVKYYKDIVPEAVSVRSHSIAQSTPILSVFEKYGFKFDCNTFIPYSSNIILQPYKYWTDNLIKVPYFWEDDIHCIYKDRWNVNKFLKYEGIKIFDFHPIHIFLNTEHLDRYEKSRKYHKDKQLVSYINNEQYGICNFLVDLIEVNI